MALKILKLHQFLIVWHELSPYTQTWVSEWGKEFENFSKNGCFLIFEW